MPINAEDFYTSNVSGLTSSSEIERRNAISRTYYAMYHKALNIGINVISYGNQGSHQNLVDTMLNTPHLKRAAYILSSSKTMRHIADYNLQDTVLESQATTMHTNYNNFSTAVQTTPKKSNSSQIKEPENDDYSMPAPDKTIKRPMLSVVK